MRYIALLVAVLVVPTGAIAQEASHSFADLSRKGALEEGEKIQILLDLTGNGEYEEVKTEFLAVNDSAITIKVDSLPQGRMQNVSMSGSSFRVEVPEERVRRIEQKHGPSTGLGVGLGVLAGGALGIVAGIAASEGSDSGPAGAMLGLLVGGAVGGTALGLTFRAMNSEEVHYTSMGSSRGSVDVGLVPIVSKKKKGALLTLTW